MPSIALIAYESGIRPMFEGRYHVGSVSLPISPAGHIANKIITCILPGGLTIRRKQPTIVHVVL